MLTFPEKVQFALGLLPAIIVRAHAPSSLRCGFHSVGQMLQKYDVARFLLGLLRVVYRAYHSDWCFSCYYDHVWSEGSCSLRQRCIRLCIV